MSRKSMSHEQLVALIEAVEAETERMAQENDELKQQIATLQELKGGPSGVKRSYPGPRGPRGPRIRYSNEERAATLQRVGESFTRARSSEAQLEKIVEELAEIQRLLRRISA